MSETFSLKLTPNLLEVMPGQEVQALVEVENTGHILDVYSIEVAGLDSSWVNLSEGNFSVFPGNRATAVLSFRPPGVSNTIANTYEYSVEVSSQYFPGQRISIPGQLVVQPIYSFFHDLHPSRVTGAEGRFTNTISNTGNADLTFTIQGETPEGLCAFLVQPNPVTVPPQERLDVDILAKPTRRRWLGKNKTYNITLTVIPEQTPQVATFAATLEALPRLRLWHLALAALFLLLLLVLAYSGYWAAFEREDLTYLRQETWPVELKPFGAAQGVVFPILVHIRPKPRVAEASPLPLHLRVSVEWQDSGDVPLSLALILRDPAGNCWEHRHVARTAGPIQFPIFSGGTPCGRIEFNRLLLDHSDKPAKPARYAPLDVVVQEVLSGHGHVHIEPVDQYCVRKDGSVIFDGMRPRLAAAHGLTSDEKIDYWTLYVVNSNDMEGYEEPPQISIRLKASVLDKGRTEKDGNYELLVIAVPHPGTPVAASDETTCEIAWDDSAGLGTSGKLIEGFIYVMGLEFCHRSDPACQPEKDVPEYVPQGEGELHVLADLANPCLKLSQAQLDEADHGGAGPAMVCGDLLWEKGQDDTGNSAFVILRDPGGNCWASLESKTVAELDQPTPFAFEMEDALPCEEVLRDEVLWYLVNWFPTDADLPKAATYDSPVEPLVRLCGSDATTVESFLVFNSTTVIPEVHPHSYPTTTQGWHLFVINGSIYATDVSANHEYAPRVSLHVTGDERRRAILSDPASSGPELPSPVAPCSADNRDSSTG